MRVHIRTEMQGVAVDEVIEAQTAEDVVAEMKNRVSARMGFAVRLFINSMSPLAFAREVVVRYNQATEKNLPSPTSCQDFLDIGVREGIATIS
jgi:hypothetical protein